jgi:hypothetical protein
MQDKCAILFTISFDSFSLVLLRINSIALSRSGIRQMSSVAFNFVEADEQEFMMKIIPMNIKLLILKSSRDELSRVVHLNVT